MSSFGADSRRLRLVEQIVRLPEGHLGAVERFLQALPAMSPFGGAGATPATRDWPHAPLHRVSEQGTYIVTTGTYQKAHHFRGVDRLDYLESLLLTAAKEAGWQLEAWAVFSNHYHFVGYAQAGCQDLANWLAELHRQTAAAVNRLDQVDDRRIWFNYRDTQLTFETSYLARLNYVHQNAVKHGLVPVANQYRWCSAAWFERTATPAQVRTLYGFKIDQVNVPDDYEPAC